MKVREVLRVLKRDGWFEVAAKGGHRQLKHPWKPGRVTVSGRLDHDLHPRTLRSVLRQGGLVEE